MARPYIKRRPATSNVDDGGQDSFLDVISNMVGILIILVMVAGARVGSVPDSPQKEEPAAIAADSIEKEKTPADPLPSSVPDTPNPELAKDYVELGTQFENVRKELLKTQGESKNLASQMTLIKQQADGAEREHSELITNIGKIEAMIQNETKKKDEKGQESFKQAQELSRIQEENKSLEQMRAAVAAIKPKSKLLENIPTPVSQKVEGHEAFFCLRNGRISHVPMNVFTERVRGSFRGFNDLKKKLIDETIGPVDDYSFHYQASVHQVRYADGYGLSIAFDYGECIPTNGQVGEPIAAALSTGSVFEKKLALYLQDASTITLFVYPDSFNELRNVKTYLLQRKYSIALRPMPSNQNITISPNGTKSTTY